MKSRGKKEPGRTGRERPKGNSNRKDDRGWQRPDGRVLRKRKGEFFPDGEIDKLKEKRKANYRRNSEESAGESTPRPSGRGYGKPSTEEGRSDSTDRKFKSDRNRFSDRPERSERAAPGGKSRFEEKPESRSFRDRTPGKRFEEREPYRAKRENRDEGKSDRFARKSDRDFGSDRRKTDERNDGKPFRSRDKDRGSRGRETGFGRKRNEYFKNDKKHFSSEGRRSGSASAQGELRLNRFIANTGLCSRREADELIEAGVISINGTVVTQLGTKVMPGDEVRYNGEPLRTEKFVYFLLNKPKDFITTTDDPEERKTVMNLMEGACKERIYPVGRLDRNTTGLLILTNDGDLTKKLTHPSHRVKKVYHVELNKNLTVADMKTIGAGMELEDGPVMVDQIAYASPDDKKMVGVELHSGRNRIVRRIFEELGYEVKKLDRTVFAGLTKKDLPRGKWRKLTELEVNALKMLPVKSKKAE